MRLVCFGKLNTKDITLVEKERELMLPDSYKKFLLETNGGVVETRTAPTIEIPNTYEKIKVSIFYGLNLEDERNIINCNQKHNGDIEKGSLIIGADTIGNYIVLVPYNAGISVCYWDIKLNLSISTEDANAYILFNSFEEFLEEVGGIEIININKGDKNMNRIDYYALGSIVLLEGGIQKILITSRGLVVKNGDKEVFFDYAGVMYPEGLTSERIVYFNHDSIAKVIFEGYSDDDDKVIVNNINNFLEKNPNLEKGNVNDWEG